MNKWDFKPKKVNYADYSDGTVVPHLEIAVYKNDQYIGYVEVHMHKVKDDTDSVGVTVRLK